MNPETGAIAHFETEDDAKEAGYTVPLDAALAKQLQQLKREERRALVSDVDRLTRHHPLARLAGMTDGDVRKLRNAAKRARKARK